FHVTGVQTCALPISSAGFALLGVAGLAGLLFLVEARALKAKRTPRLRLPSLEALDRVNLLALAIGFPLLTFAVLAGMIWTQGMKIGRASRRERGVAS